MPPLALDDLALIDLVNGPQMSLRLCLERWTETHAARTAAAPYLHHGPFGTDVGIWLQSKNISIFSRAGLYGLV